MSHKETTYIEQLEAEITTLQIELAEAKKLLRLAVEDIGKTPCNNDVYTPSSCDVCAKKENCDYSESFKWRYAEEVMKLIGGDKE